MGLLVLGLAAGCRSTQTVYRVTPAVGVAVATPAVPAAGERGTAPAPTIGEPSSAPAAPVTAQSLGSRPHRAVAPRRLRAAATAPAPAIAGAVRALKSNPRLLRAVRRAAAPPNTAESGLGTTFLGILGILAIPVGLIGLLLSGGALAWGIVAVVGGLLLLNAIFEPFAD